MSYIPKVGEECEYCNPNRDNIYHRIFFIGYDRDGDMVVQRKDGLKGIKYKEQNLVFRPLKTPAEIKRSESIDNVVDVLGHDYNDDSVIKMLGDLYDAGMLGKKQVKPLSFDDFVDLYVGEGYLPSLYKRLKPYIIQGGE